MNARKNLGCVSRINKKEEHLYGSKKKAGRLQMAILFAYEHGRDVVIKACKKFQKVGW